MLWLFTLVLCGYAQGQVFESNGAEGLSDNRLKPPTRGATRVLVRARAAGAAADAHHPGSPKPAQLPGLTPYTQSVANQNQCAVPPGANYPVADASLTGNGSFHGHPGLK